MLDLLKLQITVPDHGVSVQLTLNAVETHRILRYEKFFKLGAGFRYQETNLRDQWQFQGGINGEAEVTYFETGNLFNQGVLYKGPIRDLIVK